MFHIKTLLALVALLAAAVAAAAVDPACLAPPLASGACDFYERCLEAAIPCGPTGYALGYGKKYCSRFHADVYNMSAAGKHWVAGTLVCLQKALVPALQTKQPLACDALIDAAFDTHPACYVDNGFCTLPLEDTWKILRTIDAKDELSLRGLKQEIAVLEKCALHPH